MLKLGNPRITSIWVKRRWLTPDRAIAVNCPPEAQSQPYPALCPTGGIPVATDGRDGLGASLSPSTAQHGTLCMKTILVIENDRPTQAALISTLEAQGFCVVGAEDNKLALRQARAIRPDLIISEVAAPGLNGHAILQQVRQDPRLAGTPFIFLTSRASRSEIRQGMNLGADDYLTKPLMPAELIETITACLRKQAQAIAPYEQQMHRNQLALERIAYWDEVTGLPNRRLFGQQVQQVMAQSRQSQRSVAVFCLSVDQLHTITVTFGQEMGAALLQAISQRLRQVEALAIARLGDTEFGLVFADAWQHQQVAHVAQRLLDVVTAPYTLNGHEVRIQLSIGVASYPQHGSNPEALLMQSNTAMRWCQQQAQSGYRFYNPTMTTVEAERHLIATDLGRAIERQELEVYYQPQIDVRTGRMIGVEALLRWRHPQRGMISPSTFIPIAEELGLIVSIGEWVLRTACREFSQFQRRLPHPLKLAVNLSMRQLQQVNFVELVERILRETGMNPAHLQLELTESCLMKQVNTTIYTLQQLKQLGLAISIDDFGTGYSSLTYLSKLPIDALKIDHTFVSQLTIDKNAGVISNTIIDMAQRLNLDVVAEGVETQGQLMFLHQLGCQSVQGFLYSPPLNLQEVISFMHKKPSQLLIPAAAETWMKRASG
jgi:diguanylate cyclase